MKEKKEKKLDKKLGIEDLKNICDARSLLIKFKDVESIPEKLKIIKDSIREPGRISAKTLRDFYDYLISIKEQLEKEIIITEEEKTVLEQVSIFDTPPPSSEPPPKLEEEVNNFEAAEKPNIKTNNGEPPIDSRQDIKKPETEETSEQIKATKDGVFINKEDLEKYQKAIDISTEQEKKIEELNKRTEELQIQILQLEESQNSTKTKKKHDFTMEFQHLNDILNNSEKVSVLINRELLSKCTKYIDDNSLLKLENLIRHGLDINVSIIHSIMLTFLRQNSLDDI